MRLLEVELVVLYRAEVWGGDKHAAGTGRTGTAVSSKNHFGRGQATPKSVAAVQNEDGPIGMGSRLRQGV